MSLPAGDYFTVQTMVIHCNHILLGATLRILKDHHLFLQQFLKETRALSERVI